MLFTKIYNKVMGRLSGVELDQYLGGGALIPANNGTPRVLSPHDVVAGICSSYYQCAIRAAVT